MAQYLYTQYWFSNCDINRRIKEFVDCNQKHIILEIGCYEGMSSMFFADNLLNHPDSRMVCVDPFLSIDNNDHVTLLQNNQESNFDHNISVCPNKDKITVHKVTSDEFFKINDQSFDIIYIDGSHAIDVINRDMENAFKVLSPGGIQWHDDYLGTADGIVTIKDTMDAFVARHAHELTVINRGYQLAIRKL